MATPKPSVWVPILVALIGVAGVIGAAVISRNATISTDPATVVDTIPREPVRTPAPPSAVAITGVLIGKAEDEFFVSEALTQFAPRDEVAITVHYTAAAEVSNFPVRLSARVASGIGNGVEEQITDVSKPGDTFWTFRFKPKSGWIGSQHFVWIRINGHDVYSQQFDVVGE